MRLLSYSLIMLAVFLASAQQQDSIAEKRVGEIEDAQILIRKERSFDLISRDRLLLPPDMSGHSQPKLALTFDSTVPVVAIPAFRPKVEVPDIQPAQQEETYRNELSIGAGNYLSPYLSATLSGQQSGYSYGFNTFYEGYMTGPVRDRSSGEFDYRLGGTYTRSFGHNRWSTNMAFQRHEYYFYGLSDEAFTMGGDSVVTGRSHWNNVSVTSRLSGGKSKFRYHLTPRLGLVRNGENGGDRFSRELNLGFQSEASYALNSKNSIAISIHENMNSFDATASSTRNLFSITPSYNTSVGSIDIRLGFQLNLIDDGGGDNQSQIGAVLDLALPLAEGWQLQAGLGNSARQNTLEELFPENAFLGDSLSLLTTIIKVPLSARIDGTILPGLNIYGGVLFTEEETAPYFIPFTEDTSRFVLRYDQTALTRFKYFFGTVYRLGEAFEAGLEYAIFENNAGSELEAWYRPETTLSGYVQFQKGALSIRSKVAATGGMFAPRADGGVHELPAILDLQLAAKYQIGEQISIFARAQNLLNKEYEYYLAYPSRALAAKVGISYLF